MKTFGNKRLIKVWLVMGAIGVVFGAGVVTQGEVSAATSSLTVNIASSISLDLNPIYPNGTFASSSTSDNTISVKTDNFTGYTLGIAAKTANNNALTYTNNDVVVATIPSITSAVSATNYNDNTYASSNELNNTWGFRPSKYNSVDNTVTNNYYPAPTSTEENNIVLDTTSAANPSTFNNYNIAIGARVDMATQPGAYNNTFVITVVANAIAYSITYNKNTTDTVTNMPANVSNATTLDTSITLGSAPIRDGYKFMGWCTTAVADGGTCNSPNTQYTAGGSYTIDQVGGTNNLSLYAMWKEGMDCSKTNSFLYCKVANQVKKNNGNEVQQTASDLQAVIDTSNSGVFLYNSGEFGTSSDVDDGYNIYYFRGILDSNLNNTTSTYGSNGDSAYYQNYVKLGDTCWRIVRTTASGGTKMIYNGLYSGGTTANSCANKQTNAQVSTYAYGSQGNSAKSDWYNNINRIGYTYNANVDDSTDSTKTVGEVFGDNETNKNVNSTNSYIKDYIESWFNSTIRNYGSILEPSAGYCNDRSAFSDTAGSGELATITPYATSNATMYFGSYTRHLVNNGTHTLTLTCPRGTVDLYSVSGATNGNGQLSKPIALLTSDEVALAGSGSGGRTSASTRSSNYSYSSYLRSGGSFWLLSPYFRNSYGYAIEFFLNSGGNLGSNYVNNTFGVRPAISLQPGTTAASGTGTATDPWVVTAP